MDYPSLLNHPALSSFTFTVSSQDALNSLLALLPDDFKLPAHYRIASRQSKRPIDHSVPF